MSESSLRVIVLLSLVYPYFELEIEQDEIIMQNLVIKQETEWIKWFHSFFASSKYFGVILTGGI